MDVPWLFNRLNEIMHIKRNDGTKLNILIVFDDVVSQLKDLERDQLINNLFLNRRHILPNATISIIIATQKYNLVPLRFRTVATSLVLFDLGRKEM